MIVVGEFDREINEVMCWFFFCLVIIGFSIDCDKFIIFIDIKLLV